LGQRALPADLVERLVQEGLKFGQKRNGILLADGYNRLGAPMALGH
jgi:hypothetical protein